MPRPRVKPQDRQRSERACDPCKASKKRCDAGKPCRPCVKKGIHESCTYTSSSRARRSRPGTPPPPVGTNTSEPSRSTIAVGGLTPHSNSIFAAPLGGSNQPPGRLTNGAYLGGDIISPASIQTSTYAGETTRQSYLEDDAESESTDVPSRDTEDSEPATEQRPVMLASSSGDKVFVGNTAALSFLHFLQGTLKQYVGPSGFTDRQHSHNLFELASSDIGAGVFYDDLADQEKDELIQNFLDASYGFLDLYTRDELSALLDFGRANRAANDACSIQGIERVALASLYAMIAIGAQCRGSSREDLVCAAKYFTQARKMAFENMLEDPTINLVRTFLLMAFYMLGACRRNPAFMYIGVASKSADILGLHAAAQYRHMSKAERDSRLRTAKSLRVFDIVCSSILGRRGSAMSLHSINVSPSDLAPESGGHRALALRATYESCSVLRSVVVEFTENGSLDPRSAEKFLQLLREWSQALPASLRQQPQTGGEAQSRGTMIGNIHVAGTYYFGVILVTRQFLIQHIMPQLRGKPSRRRGSSSRADGAAASAEAVADLSRACVEAATYMAQMCGEAEHYGVLLGSMCIIKAWIFAAGLVLGFSLLVDDDSNSESHEAFRGSIQVLAFLGRLSAQAEQYHGILTSFSDAIDAYRKQLRRERNEARVPFVERILSLEKPSQPGTGGGGHGVTETQADGITKLPTPDFTTSDGSITGGGIWEGDDAINSMSLSDFMPDQWQGPPGDDELMLRLLWDGYAMSFNDTVLHQE